MPPIHARSRQHPPPTQGRARGRLLATQHGPVRSAEAAFAHGAEPGSVRDRRARSLHCDALRFAFMLR